MFVIEDKFSFIHIPKTSGSSFTKVVSPFISRHKQKTRLSGVKWQNTWHFNDLHAYPRILIPEDISLIKRQDVITIVRNPYSRLCSFFNNFNDGKYKTFKEFVLNLPESSKKIYDRYQAPFHQLDYILNDYGINVKIYKFEEEPHKAICKDYGLPYDPASVVVGHGNGIFNYNKNSYMSYYDDEAWDIVSRMYKKDIEYFGYSF